MKYFPWIHTTNKCNISCDYCYVTGNEVMGGDIYKQIFEMFSPVETHLRIAGGEPLLVFDKWKEFATKYNQVEVLTNFQYIPKGYYTYNFRTSISIDDYGDKPLSKEINPGK